MTREPFCSDCPDREACATGWSCSKVRQVATEAKARLDRKYPDPLGDDADDDADPWA